MSIAVIWAPRDADTTPRPSRRRRAARPSGPSAVLRLRRRGRPEILLGRRTLRRNCERQQEVTIDMGQVMFGQTVTVPPTCAEFLARAALTPAKSVMHECDGNGGGLVRFATARIFTARSMGNRAGTVPADRRSWRVFLTTDHPNGGIHGVSPTLRAADGPALPATRWPRPFRPVRWRSRHLLPSLANTRSTRSLS